MFDLALERCGFVCAWQVEIDPTCTSVLARHWPHVKRYGDIQEVSGYDLGAVSLICGGSPCQDLSVAGKGVGLAGSRSRLFFEFTRLCQEVQPEFALWENVPQSLSSHSGRDWAAILRAFRECGARELAWRVLDAKHFGVAQQRRRVFVVADFTDRERAAEILFEPESSTGYPASCREEGARPTAFAHRSPDESSLSVALTARAAMDRPESRPVTLVASTLQGGSGGGHGRAGSAEGAAGGHLVPTVKVAGSLTARYGKGTDSTVSDPLIGVGPFGFDLAQITSGINRATVGDEKPAPTLSAFSQMHVAHALISERADASEDGTGRGVPLTVALRGRDGGATAEVGGDVAGALRASQGGSDKPHVLAFARQQGVSENDRSYPVRAGEQSGTLTVTRVDAVQGEWGVRRLTPQECEKLMGLPEGYSALDADGKKISDSARYRMLGNGVVVPVIQWIGECLLAALQQDQQNEEASS